MHEEAGRTGAEQREGGERRSAPASARENVLWRDRAVCEKNRVRGQPVRFRQVRRQMCAFRAGVLATAGWRRERRAAKRFARQRGAGAAKHPTSAASPHALQSRREAQRQARQARRVGARQQRRESAAAAAHGKTAHLTSYKRRGRKEVAWKAVEVTAGEEVEDARGRQGDKRTVPCCLHAMAGRAGRQWQSRGGRHVDRCSSLLPPPSASKAARGEVAMKAVGSRSRVTASMPFIPYRGVLS